MKIKEKYFIFLITQSALFEDKKLIKYLFHNIIFDSIFNIIEFYFYNLKFFQ